MKKNKIVKPTGDEILELTRVILDPDISSEARIMAIKMLEKLIGREIKTKRDILAIDKEYSDVHTPSLQGQEEQVATPGDRRERWFGNISSGGD